MTAGADAHLEGFLLARIREDEAKAYMLDLVRGGAEQAIREAHNLLVLRGRQAQAVDVLRAAMVAPNPAATPNPAVTPGGAT